jgi:hypothetical protein
VELRPRTRCFITALAATSLMLIVPASAAAAQCEPPEVEANGTAASDWPAGGGTGRCVSYSEWQVEREAAKQADEAQTAAEVAAREQQLAAETAAREEQRAAEAAAREQQQAAEARAREAKEKRETGGPPTKLHVKVASAHGLSYRSPGHTVLYVETDEFAEVTFTFTYPGHPQWRPDSFHFKERPGKAANPAAGENDAAVDPWSCRAPMLVEDWEVEVKGEEGGVVESGPGLVERGQVLDDVSKSWCEVARHREERLARRRRAANKQKRKA